MKKNLQKLKLHIWISHNLLIIIIAQIEIFYKLKIVVIKANK